MGDWRFYAQRPGSGLWLDTNLQINPEMTFSLSAPASGQATVPAGLGNAYAEDGRKVFNKWDTLVFGEEDGNLAWCGICTAANPSKEGLSLEFIGPFGWLARVPFRKIYSRWNVNVFDVARMLVAHSRDYKPGFDFITPNDDSIVSVGDVEPPNKPKEPGRNKGETKSEYHSSKRYQDWQDDISKWNSDYGDRKPFTIAWWEAPFVGEEFDTLAKENQFDYRERVKWEDKGDLIPRFYLDFADDLSTRREDIKFVDGLNIATTLDPKDGDEEFANHVIGLGAGEGRKMTRVMVGETDGRLYQAAYTQYKSIRDEKRLRKLAEADHRILNNKDPKIDNVTVWDVPGFASLATLRCGDEVEVISQNLNPPLGLWGRVIKITRKPTEATVVVTLEVVA